MALDAAEVTLALLASRAPGATVCPSEVARAMASAARVEPAATAWRGMMPTVHAAVDGLVAQGRVRLSWKGTALDRRAGPYRIGHGDRGARGRLTGRLRTQRLQSGGGLARRGR